MELQQALHSVEIGGVKATTNFSLELNAKTAHLLADPYSDKIGAVVREIVCNALDAHVSIGNKNPITIKVPNSLEPWFSVIDNGPGISNDDMLSLYTKYGHSSKDASNAFIGAFGIGRFSALSYGESFSLISRHKPTGKKTFYTVTKNEIGVPILLTNGSVDLPAGEESGFEVRVPIKSGDLSTFVQRVRTFIRWIDPLPKIIGGSIVPEKMEIVSEASDKSWFTAKNSRNLIGLMGPVEYRIDPMKIFDCNNRYGELHAKCEAFDNVGLVIRFAMGEVATTISREELSYTPQTIAAVKKRLDAFVASAAADLNSQFAKYPTLWEARKAYAKFSKGQNGYLRRLVKSDYSYRGKALSPAVKLDTPIANKQVFADIDLNDLNYQDFKLVYQDWLSLDMDYMHKIVVDDLKTNPKTADKHIPIKDFLRHNFADGWDDAKSGITPGSMRGRHGYACGHKLVILRELDATQIVDILTKLGDPPVSYLSDYEIPEKKRRVSSGAPKKKVKVKQYDFDSNRWDEVDLDLDIGGVYVPLFGAECKEPWLRSLYSDLKELEIEFPLYGIQATVRSAEKMAEDPGWTLLRDHAKALYQAKAKELELDKYYLSMETLEEDTSGLGGLWKVEASDIKKLPDRHLIRRYWEHARFLESLKKKHSAYEDLLRLFDETKPAKPRPISLSKMQTEIMERWPLLQHLGDYSSAWVSDWADTLSYLTK